MARITAVTYQRVKSVAQFETKRLHVTAEVSEWEDPEDVLADLQTFVDDKLEGRKSKVTRFKPVGRPHE